MRRWRARTMLALALALRPTAAAGATETVLARGQALYRERCAVCHGTQGGGDGEAAYLLVAPPRDLRAGPFRFTSTWEGIPTDEDLLRTLTNGLPGSQMPAFARLSASDRQALAAAVQTLAERPRTIPPSRPPTPDGAPGTGLVVVPPEPRDTRTSSARAAELFRDACADCHGPDGRGSQRTDLVDARGRPIRPRDLTTGVFKGDASPEGLYRRIVAGIPGTPMPSNAWAYGDDAWYLVRHVLALSRRPPPLP